VPECLRLPARSDGVHRPLALPAPLADMAMVYRPDRSAAVARLRALARPSGGPRVTCGPGSRRGAGAMRATLRRAQGCGTVRANGERPMICIFIQLRCRPGRTYEVADAIYDMEFASELYSTSGEWDLLMKVYVPEGEDVGRFVADRLRELPDVDRSLTTMTFKAF
jgi:DNA-binding Lrp family transcriptional regulator